MRHSRRRSAAMIALAALAAPVAAHAQFATAPDTSSDLSAALPAAGWREVDQSTARALRWLAQQQRPDGAFPTAASGQPAITSLCVMAYLSCGHQPGVGPYGQRLDRAIDYTLACQQPSGLFSLEAPQSAHVHQGASHTVTYNHAIAGLMLCEAYGQTSGERSVRIRRAVERGVAATARLQKTPRKKAPQDRGGWRYLHSASARGTPSDSDLSVTGWHLMFLRSAKNAQFDVPDEVVEAAMGYVQRCYNPATGEFYYGIVGVDRYASRGMVGAGALSLSLGGKHNTKMARSAGDWLLAHPFDRYGQTAGGRGDRFHYSAYYCSQAMAQLGGRYWNEFFPTLARTLISGQQSDGSWVAESGEDAMYGSTYPTALSVLALTPAYQLLPIYQR